MHTLENLVYAVSASENWLIRVKYLVSEKPAGRLERLEGVKYMVMTDPIADMLTRIRNALVVKHASIDVPASNIKMAIADILQEEDL